MQRIWQHFIQMLSHVSPITLYAFPTVLLYFGCDLTFLIQYRNLIFELSHFQLSH